MPAPPFLTSIAGSGTAKYLADQYGAPYLLRWDSIWGLIVNAGNSGGATTWQSDMDNYCSIRAGQGFNGFLSCPVMTTQSGIGTNDNGQTWDGVLPFTSPGVLNDTFWQRVDYLLNSAANNGQTVVLNVMFTYALSTAGGVLDAAVWTSTQYQNYGAAVGARYATVPNLIWEEGDDYWGGTYDTPFTSFLSGLRGAGANQLVSVENIWESTSRKSLDGTSSYAWGASNAQFQWGYSYSPAYNVIEFAYAEANPLCVAKMDGWYESMTATTESNELFMRKLYWWTLSSGARGYMYGRQDLHKWSVNTISSGQLAEATSDCDGTWNTIMNSFSALRGWHQLVPDTGSALVTAGRGTRAAQLPPGGPGNYTGGNTFVSASKTADGTLAVIYIPAGGTITVNGGLMGAAYGAKWMDPQTGATSTATIASTYTTPGTNSAGDSDWVLVLATPPYATWTVP